MARVKVQASVKTRNIEDVGAGLTYISSLPLAKSAFQLDKIKEQLLEHLRAEFPYSPPAKRRNRRYEPHLRTGWMTTEIPSLESKVGFVLYHRRYKDDRVKTILMSLEYGSRAHKIIVEKNRFFSELDGKEYGLAVFIPGDGRGKRHGKNEGANFAMKGVLNIPRRKGVGYMKSTLQLAKKLVADAKPQYFKKIKQALNSRGIKTK